MKRNFRFDPMTVVAWGDATIDLHNDFDLTGFGTSPSGDEVRLSFKRNNYAQDPASIPESATITCSGNVRVAFNDACAIAAPLNDEGIELAYFDEGCEWGSFIDERLALQQEPIGLHVSFINGFAVRIFCDEARFAVH